MNLERVIFAKSPEPPQRVLKKHICKVCGVRLRDKREIKRKKHTHPSKCEEYKAMLIPQTSPTIITPCVSDTSLVLSISPPRTSLDSSPILA